MSTAKHPTRTAIEDSPYIKANIKSKIPDANAAATPTKTASKSVKDCQFSHYLINP